MCVARNIVEKNTYNNNKQEQVKIIMLQPSTATATACNT